MSKQSSRPCLVSGSLLAPWWRLVVGFGLAAGAVRWRLRASTRAFSGAVVVVGFSSLPAAQSFASSFAWLCGQPLAVRRFAGPVFGVSVPVRAPAGSAALRAPVPQVPAPVVWVAR